MNIFKNLAMLSIAAVMFVACGGDNGSSARDEDSSSSVADEEKSSSSTKNGSSSDKESSSSAKESSSSQSKYVCDIYTLSDALSCKCDESREGKLSYNYDSDVELVCIHDEELNKWGWVVKKEESSSSSAKSSSSTAKSSSSVASSSSAKSSSSSSSTTENQEGSSSSSKDSKYAFEWNTLSEWLTCVCDETRDGWVGIALYRSDKSEFVCEYDEDSKKWAWTRVYVPSSSSSSAPKSSSSSAKSSSSSEYVPYDHFGDLEGGFYIDRNRYKQFTDSRNGRSYYYITITGKDTNKVTTSVTVMAENLNIGTMVNGADDQADDGVLERYCYKNDTTYCDQYGALYQWAEMMDLPSRCNTESCADKIQKNHQGICPEGWRLLTYNDFMIILTSEDNDSGVKGLRSSVFNGSNASGYSLVGAGLRTPYSEKFRYLNEETAWFYPEEHSSEEKNSYISYVMIGSISPDGSNDLKTYGMSVRCVMVE